MDYKRIMALDPGSVRTGVAISDPLNIIANPWGYLESADRGKFLERVSELARENAVSMIVVGLPMRMDGTKGTKAEESEALAETLKEMGFNVTLVDERLSSKEAEGLLIMADVRRNKRKKAVDKVAAAVILQKYLDTRKRESERRDINDTEGA
ncbi:MAG: Holliday junction resolvase RuvX [Candidatus Xenobiia bacterium LiM19]